MPSKKIDPVTLANDLLEAQVAFWLQNLKGKKFEGLVADEVGRLYDQLQFITLNEAVDRDTVKATAQRYAVEMDIGGGIPELFGEIARVIFEFPASKKTALGEVVSDVVATEFIEKVFEQGGVIDHTLANVRNSAAFKHFLSDVVFTVLKGYLLEQNKGTRLIRDWLSSKVPELSGNLEDRIRHLMDSGVAGSLDMVNEALDHQQYRETAMHSALEFWDVVRQWPLSSYRDYITEQDLQEFMVLGYEFWLNLRDTPYMKACIDAGVEFFFDKYGEETLQTLLDEIGVSREMVIEEISNYAPHLANLMIAQGLAESFIRRHLKRFYHSKKTLEILGS